MSCENNAYTMKGLVYTSDGTDYADLVKKSWAFRKTVRPWPDWTRTKQSSISSRPSRN